MHTSVILNTDSYKLSMWKQYPPNTTGVFSYIESRGGKYDYTLFFGLQSFIKEYLRKPFHLADIIEAERVANAHGEPFNREGWEYILREHGGYLPLRIRAVPEGTIVPVKNVLATIENTDPKCFWLTTWVETALLRGIWYPTTVATQSWSIKQVIKKYMEDTCDDLSGLDYKLHDFGSRGVSSLESAEIGGAAHLVNFKGTDTIAGILHAMTYYSADCVGLSVPAAEHSTITSWGKEQEVDAYRNMLRQFANPGSVVAVVSDSYNIYNACQSLWGEKLRDDVINSGATLVIRPDSGIPHEVVLKCLRILENQFGSMFNTKGYKVLNHVRVLQGDGIEQESINRILHTITSAGFSADNVAFGMGGALLQKVDRDTQKWAMKCSSVKIDGQWCDVFKDPIDDSGKRSKRGRVALYKSSDTYFTDIENNDVEHNNCLVTVFEDGELITEYSFDEIRERSNNSL